MEAPLAGATSRAYLELVLGCDVSLTSGRNTYSSILRAPLASSSVIRTLPFSFSRSDEAERLINPDPDGAINRFGVRAGQSLQEWEKAGWIWAEDPRGWAEWYIRFWDGRRCEDDERQVKRCTLRLSSGVIRREEEM